MKKILCAGQLVADIVVRPVDSFDYETDTRLVDTIQIKNGGDAMNTAVALGKLGAPVIFAGRVGDDAQGAFLKSALERAGVKPFLAVDGGAPTATCAVMIASSGERSFLYCGGANYAFSASDISDKAIAECDHVQIGGVYMLNSFDGENAAGFMSRAKALGKTISMDVTYDTSGVWYDTIKPMLPLLDFFMPSLGEAKHIAGSDDPEKIADFFLSKGVKTAVIKLGKDGCLVKNRELRARVPIYGGLKPVDTTGAGDCFCAGFLCGYARGFNLIDCAKTGNAAAGFCVTKIGATDGVPSWDTLEAYMRANEIIAEIY